MPKKLKPVHPGEILREEFMKPLGLSMNRMALDLRVPLTRVADIVHERRGITTDTALRLARYFKTSPTFWLRGTTWKLWEAVKPTVLPVTSVHSKLMSRARREELILYR